MSISETRAGAKIAVAAASLAILASCTASPAADDAPADDSASPVAGGTLQFVHDTDPGCLDPQQAANWSLDLGRNVVDSLLDQHPDTHEFLPWLASEWEANADGTAFTFTIRDGVTFSDGTELTAEVVKQNFDSVKHDLGAKAPYVAGVFSTYVDSVVEGDAVTVRFSQPNFPFVQAASSPPPSAFSQPARSRQHPRSAARERSWVRAPSSSTTTPRRARCCSPSARTTRGGRRTRRTKARHISTK